MGDPISLGYAAVVGAIFALAPLPIAIVAVQVRSFNRRYEWTDDATHLEKVRVHAEHIWRETDWRTVARTIPKLAVLGALTSVTLVVFAIGLLEVLG